MIVGAGLAVFAVLRTKDQKNEKSNTTEYKIVAEKACGLLTDGEIQGIFGQDMKQADHAPIKSGSPAAQTDKKTKLPSVCTYTRGADDKQYPMVITMLPASTEEVSKQMKSITSAKQFKRAETYGNEAYQETNVDPRGRKYHRVVIGYSNAIVTITLDDANIERLGDLVNIVQKKVQKD